MLKVYGHPASQPSRAVIWACVLHELPIQVMVADPDQEASVNPRGQVPSIDDERFILSEMPAILTYLCERYSWSDLYPDDLRQRARISQYLHAHHSLTRLATMKLMAPYVLVAFGGNPTSNPLNYINNFCIQTSMEGEAGLAEAQVLVLQVIDFLERAYLGDQDFVAGTPRASIADIACYEEIGQLEAANLVDLSGNAKISAWIDRMRDLPKHDKVHRYNTALGDIKTVPNSMERFSEAVTQAFAVLSELPHVTIE